MSQCTAKTERGRQCRRPPIPGGSTCAVHRNVPQVSQNASEGLAAVREQAIGFLQAIMRDDTVPAAVRVNAARALLQRADAQPVPVEQTDNEIRIVLVKPEPRVVDGELIDFRPAELVDTRDPAKKRVLPPWAHCFHVEQAES